MVNQKAFQDAGIDLPTRDWTYEDYKKNAEAFSTKSGMKILADGSVGEPPLENFLRQRGKALYTADGQLAFDSNDMVDYFKLWADLRDAGTCVGPEDQALDATAAIDTTMISLHKAATSFANSNQLIGFQAVNPDPLTMINFPRVSAGSGGGHYRKPSMFWSVNPKSALLEDSVKFVSFFINNVDAGMVLGVERGIPCAKHVRDALAPTLSPPDQLSLNFVSNLGDLLGPLPPSPPAAAGEVSVPTLVNASQSVAFGQASPEDAATQFVEEAQAILARSKKG
jgi:multiple sugar transport system substrate-binding protein